MSALSSLCSGQALPSTLSRTLSQLDSPNDLEAFLDMQYASQGFMMREPHSRTTGAHAMQESWTTCLHLAARMRRCWLETPLVEL